MMHKLPHMQPARLDMDMSATVAEVMEHLRREHRIVSHFKLRIIKGRVSVYLRKDQTLAQARVDPDALLCVLYRETPATRRERLERQEERERRSAELEALVKTVKTRVKQEVRRELGRQRRNREFLDAVRAAMAEAQPATSAAARADASGVAAHAAAGLK